MFLLEGNTAGAFPSIGESTQLEVSTTKLEELVYFRIPKSGSNAFLKPLARAQQQKQGHRRIRVIDHGDGCRNVGKCNASTYSQETFAIIREPCDRFRSQYYHQRKKVPDLLEQWTPENFLAFMESTCSNIDEANRRDQVIQDGKREQRRLDQQYSRGLISESEWEAASLETTMRAQISVRTEESVKGTGKTAEVEGQSDGDCDNILTSLSQEESVQRESDVKCPAGVPYPAMKNHRVIMWPQALWIDAERTLLICYDSDLLEQRVQAFVFRHTGLQLDPFARPNSRETKQSGPKDDFNITDSICHRVLRLYPEDAKLWKRKCI